MATLGDTDVPMSFNAFLSSVHRRRNLPLLLNCLTIRSDFFENPIPEIRYRVLRPVGEDVIKSVFDDIEKILNRVREVCSFNTLAAMILKPQRDDQFFSLICRDVRFHLLHFVWENCRTELSPLSVDFCDSLRQLTARRVDDPITKESCPSSSPGVVR